MYKAELSFDEKIFKHLQRYYDSFVSCLKNSPSFEYWLYCILLNRLIDLQILDEFGNPNVMIFPEFQIDFDKLDHFSPCDGCEPNINSCSSCRFASSSINDSLNYSKEG